MSVRIRGKKREEIINNWLEGKDNDEYDVVPTKNEGKYIIRHKVKNINNSEEPIPEPIKSALRSVNGFAEETISEEPIPEPISEETIPEEPIPEETIPEKTIKPKQNKIRSIPESTNPVGFNEILNQLKNIQTSFNELNEERRRKQEKKAKKKEMKHIIHKEFAKNRVMVEESDDETEYRNTDPQIVYVEKPAPVRIRRRLNLLDRFK